MAPCKMSLCQNQPQLRSTYPAHGVLSVLVEKASECDLTMANLLQWSVLVRNKFDGDNMEASHLEGETLRIKKELDLMKCKVRPDA